MQIDKKHIEQQILNLFTVYFNPKAKFKFNLNKKNNQWYLSDKEQEYKNPCYFIDYHNQTLSYDEDAYTWWVIADEIESLQTHNAKLVLEIDEDECSIARVLDFMQRIFSLQTECIKDDNLFYNNKMKALFQLSFKSKHPLNDFVRRAYVRYLFWNSNLNAEINHIFVTNSVVYYKDIPLKTLLCNLLEDIKSAKSARTLAQDYIIFTLEVLEFLEQGFTEYDLISELGFCKEWSEFCKYDKFFKKENIHLDTKLLTELQKMSLEAKNFKDIFLYRMAMFNFINIYLYEKKDYSFRKISNE